ncbi:MAG: pyruvate dehydrogenase (acetyl-transferring) E1 component subunit alpha [Kiloniellales bacterium]|nr:pyruvate dehydrogenase (acetyl-transferring) E1 component subunit alpha [Kiloniellales bacterium]
MPKTVRKSPKPIELLSILSENGTVDEDLKPELSADKLVHMYRVMQLARRFDERLLNLQRQGKLGTFAPVKGQEAAQVGSIAAITDDDWFIPSFRETAAAIWRGTPLESLFLYIAGYNEGQRISEGSKNLPICIPVASQIPHAVGIAYAIKRKREDGVAMVYFGDGATSQGDFHEALNFAGVFEVPVVFLCQNNQWAISLPRERQTRSKTLAQKAISYGISGIQVDGNDVLAVYRAAKDAVDRAREDGLPTMIECITYRMEVHTTADDPSVYRSEDEVEKWEKRDPIERFKGYLSDLKLIDEAGIDALEEEIERNIEGAWTTAQDQMEGLGDASVIFDHHFAEPTALLSAQRKAFEEERAMREEAHG